MPTVNLVNLGLPEPGPIQCGEEFAHYGHVLVSKPGYSLHIATCSQNHTCVIS